MGQPYQLAGLITPAEEWPGLRRQWEKPPFWLYSQQLDQSISKRTHLCSFPFDMLRGSRYYSPRSNDSSVVQSVERRTVNPYVTGSSPVRGAILEKPA